MKAEMLTPVWVEFIPSELKEGELYISIRYGTDTHLCACGCGEKIVTPLKPQGWRLIYDGTVTLRPSIGSFEIPCQSHYYITQNKIEWLDMPNTENPKPKKKRKKRFRFAKKFPYIYF